MSHNDWRLKVKGPRKRQKPKLPRRPVPPPTTAMRDRRARLTRRAEQLDRKLD